MKVFQGVRGTQNQVPQIEVNKDTVYIRSNIERVEEDEFNGWEYDEVQYKKNEWHELVGGRSELLETDNAELWFENVMVKSSLDIAEREVADLWHQILVGGVL